MSPLHVLVEGETTTCNLGGQWLTPLHVLVLCETGTRNLGGAWL